MLKIIINKVKAELMITRITKNLNDLAPAFRDFQSYMQRQVTLMFNRIRQGGKFRGVSWEWFAPHYYRADGTAVPAEGGIPKVRGGGLVLGRLRPSGQRVSAGSSLMADTGSLKAKLLSRQSIGGTRFTMDTPSGYAEFMQQLRPFQFFEKPDDVTMLQRIINKHMVKGV